MVNALQTPLYWYGLPGMASTCSRRRTTSNGYVTVACGASELGHVSSVAAALCGALNGCTHTRLARDACKGAADELFVRGRLAAACVDDPGAQRLVESAG